MPVHVVVTEQLLTKSQHRTLVMILAHGPAVVGRCTAVDAEGRNPEIFHATARRLLDSGHLQILAGEPREDGSLCSGDLIVGLTDIGEVVAAKAYAIEGDRT